MARKGQFKKGGGRVGYASGSSRRGRATTAIVVAAPSRPPRRRSSPKRAHHKRKGRSTHRPAMSLLGLAGLALGTAYLVGPKGPEMVRTNIAKVPGSSTFGALAVVGAGGLAYDRFVKKNKYAKALGIIGVIGAAITVGSQGSDFKWVGDDESTGDIGDDDVGDDDVGDDDVGDDDVGDDD